MPSPIKPEVFQYYGLYTGLTPLYLSEISSSDIRGALGVLHPPPPFPPSLLLSFLLYSFTHPSSTPPSTGLYTGLTPLYLSEIASSDIRGALGVLHQLGVVLGILLSQVLGFQELLGNASSWEVLMGLPILPCLLQLLILPFCPESPRFLLITKQRETQAVEALKSLRGTADVKDDIEEMRKEARTQEREEKVTLLRLFQRRSFRMPLIISIMMQLSQQLSGICGIFYYSSKLFKWAGLSEETATHATSGVGGVMVVMTVITIPLMDRAGRRSLHLIGLGGMFVFSIFITVSLVLRDKVEWFNGLSIAVSLIYVAFFALGPGSIPWLIVAELFSQGARPAAMSVAVLVNWVANFIVGYSFPHMQNGLGDYAFLPFTGLLLVFWAFTFWFVPETKGKTFEEVTALWQEGGQRDSNSGSPKEHSHLVP
ncbi:glucose transporter type 1 [Aplysia californica]|uniref:Glucose transporter type 1 n=1 Tax=Aplysia californica TaxID=6500 RepID=A0ABM1A4M1_APLCA|nr:glucose transporter type 1 [Aplysia californica]